MFYYTPSPQSEKKALRSVSGRAGLALLTVCALQLGASFAAVWLRERLHLGENAWFHLVAVLSGMTVLTGAVVGRKLLGHPKRLRACPAQPPRRYAPAPQGGHPGEAASLSAISQTEFSICQDAPLGGPVRSAEGVVQGTREALRMLLLIPAGAALCMAGNLVGSLVERVAGRAGIEFQGGPEPPQAQSLPGLLLMLLTVAVLPAVAEEWLLRGCILPPLQPFGDGFAVVCTAVLFALLHQNMEQAPMAFVSGLALGWVYIRSGRLAVPMAVHLWNNAAAVVIMFLPERAENVYVLGLGLLGLLSLFILYLRRPAHQKIMCETSAGKRAANFFFGSVAMVLALVYFAVIIVLNTKVG